MASYIHNKKNQPDSTQVTEYLEHKKICVQNIIHALKTMPMKSFSIDIVGDSITINDTSDSYENDFCKIIKLNVSLRDLVCLAKIASKYMTQA